MPKRHVSSDLDRLDAVIGANLRRARERRGVTQEQLGGALGISSPQVCKYETGVNRLSASMLSRAADALSAPVSAFFADAPQAPSIARTWDPALMELAETEGAVALAQAYARLPSARLRRKAVALLAELAQAGSHEPED